MKLVEVVVVCATSTEVVEQLCQCVSGWRETAGALPLNARFYR